MRGPCSSSLLSALAAAAPWMWLATAPRLAGAHPYPRDDMHDAGGFGFLMPRQCHQYCGYQNQYCCSAGTACTTAGNKALCVAQEGAGYSLYTTTWTQTQTFTSTVQSWFPAATTAAPSPCIPAPGSGHKACGSICCDTWQYCAWDNQCMADGPAPTWATTITSNGAVITTQFSAPYRPTSGATAGQPGTTAGAGADDTVDAGGSTGGGLSPGAIAGIVVGALVGVFLLILICACCLIRGLWHGIAAILGFGNKKKHSEKTTVTEERYSRHGSVHEGRDHHGGWFGGSGRPSGASSRKTDKKSSGAGWLGLAGAAGTLLLLLGLKRDKKEKKPASRPARSRGSSAYWSASYTSSPSRVTRDTRRSYRHSARGPPSPRMHSRPPPSRRPSPMRSRSRGPSMAPSRRPSRH